MWIDVLAKDGKKKGKKSLRRKSKRRKSSKKKIQAPLIKSIARVQRYTFQDEERFFAYLPEMDLSLPLYVYFRSSKIPVAVPTPPSQPPSFEEPVQLSDPTSGDSIEEGLMKFIKYMQEDPDSKDIMFATVAVDPDRLGESCVRLLPGLRVEELPAVVRWGGPERLEGERKCANQDLLCLLFEDRDRRRGTCEDRFTDNNTILCPFLPSPEDQLKPPVSTQEAPPDIAPKKKISGKKRKGSKKKGGKKKK